MDHKKYKKCVRMYVDKTWSSRTSIKTNLVTIQIKWRILLKLSNEKNIDWKEYPITNRK